MDVCRAAVRSADVMGGRRVGSGVRRVGLLVRGVVWLAVVGGFGSGLCVGVGWCGMGSCGNCR